MTIYSNNSYFISAFGVGNISVKYSIITMYITLNYLKALHHFLFYNIVINSSSFSISDLV